MKRDPDRRHELLTGAATRALDRRWDLVTGDGGLLTDEMGLVTGDRDSCTSGLRFRFRVEDEVQPR